MLTRNLLLCISFLLLATVLQAQNRTITGKVTEAGSRAALAGATVSVKGVSSGTGSQLLFSVNNGAARTMVVKQDVEVPDKK